MFFTLVLVSFLKVGAQEYNNVPQLGIKGGVNFTTLKFVRNALAGSTTSYDSRWMGGLFGNIPFAKRWSLQLEGQYSQKGGNIKTGVSQGDIQQRLDYISVPTLLKFHATREFKVLAGAEWDFLGKATQVNQGLSTSQDNTKLMRNTGTSLVAGIQLWPFERWVFDARYIHGISEVIQAPANNLETRNRVFQLTMGYVFARRKPLAAVAPVVPATVVAAAPKDSDGDGVNDADDKCPNVAGLAKYNGCPIPDSDGDGINDEDDKCPNVAGTAKYNGCPIPDSDKDGINDEDDQCPNQAGVEKYHGCPIPDTDGDGVNDEEDRCINVAGPADNGGCPKIDFKAENVQFATGTANLTTGAKTELNKLVNILNKQYPLVRVQIQGHTDNTGKAEANQLLSENRASSVKKYLVSKGVDTDRLDEVGYGQDQPIADNATPEGRAKNRRVVFKVTE
jgi:outer membrane protein OmpA-like peptidoglycan-associated protein